MYGFHIYDATLFVGPTGLSSKELTARPFALDIEYARAFKGSSIAKRGRQEMDGLKLARAVRGRWPPIKIVATSGHLDVTETDLPEGGRFLAKPYSPRQVMGLLRELTGQV